MADVSDLFLAGQISPADFRERMRAEIKGEYIRQGVLGRGGLGRMDAESWGSVGGSIAEQYRYLDGWVAELDGVDPADLATGAFKNRAGLYVNSARESFERNQRRAIEESGAFNEERWQLGDAEHCGDCEQLAGRGWVLIGELGTVPGAGDTECLTSCKCSISYR